MADALLYPGRVNGIAGESGSGKTWVALHVAAEVIRDGGTVLYVDLEDTPAGVVGRLRTLGLAVEQISRGLLYCQPDRMITLAAQQYVDAVIAEHRPALLVIDSIGELIALSGLSSNSEDDVAQLYRAGPRRWADLGPAVLLIDHVAKSKDRSALYGVGSHRKRAAITGASYMVEQVVPFADGRPGRMHLTVAKDRHGTYAVGSVAAAVDVTSTAGRVTLDVHAAYSDDLAAGVPPAARPVEAMAKLTAWLAEQPDQRAHEYAMRQAKIAGVKTLRHALAALSAEGYVTVEVLSRRGKESTDYVLVDLFEHPET